MLKRYQIQIFEIGTPSVPKKTFSFISGNEEAVTLKTDITFDGNKNNGQGVLSMIFNKPFNYGEITLGNLVTVKAFDDDNKSGQAIYSGYVEEINRVIDTDGESVEVTALGLAALMNTTLGQNFGDPGVFAFFNTDPSIIITFILNQFNSKYPFPLISFAPIPLFGVLIDFALNNATHLELLQKVHEVTGWIFYVDGDGIFSTQPRGTVPDHIFTLKKNINAINKVADRSDIVTVLNLTVVDFSTPFPNQFVTFQYNNLPAQATFGIIERHVENFALFTNTGLQTVSIDQFAATYLDEHDSPTNFLTLEVNDTFDYITVKPGDLIRIKNIDFTIADALVNKIKYTSTALGIECEKVLDFGDEIVNLT